MKRSALLLIGVPIVLIAATAAIPKRRTNRELLEEKLPEMRLVVRQTDPRTHVTSSLYTGPGDAEEISNRLERLLALPGWYNARRKAGSAFPYAADFMGLVQRPWWGFIPFSRGLGYHIEQSLDVRVLKGCAGASPVGQAWTSVLIREGTGGMYFPDTSEPIPGYGVRLW